MHDVFNNVTPLNVSHLFAYSSKVHHHNTRLSVAGNFYLQYLRTNHLKNSFFKHWKDTPKYKFKDRL